MKLPPGVRDWLPSELARKRAIEAVLRGVFERWAYAEVQTPGFERIDVLEAGLGHGAAEKVLGFADRRGLQLALRPETTTPIARLVATRMRDAPLPLRLSYLQPIYRYEEPQEGRMREVTQAGLELIAPSSDSADAESLFTAIEAIDALGLTDAHFDINHAALVRGVVSGLELSEARAAQCAAFIAERNVVALRELLIAAGCASDVQAIVDLTMMRGASAVLEAVGRRCHTAAGVAGIERLRRILERAEALGYADRIAVDFSLLRGDFAYYTGLVFEGYVGDVGFALCGGGRYDALLPSFGYDVGAVGWSAAIERLLIALERRHRPATAMRPAIDVLVSGSDVIAARERAAGKRVRVDFDRRSEAALMLEARALGIPRVVIAGDGAVRELEVSG